MQVLSGEGERKMIRSLTEHDWPAIREIYQHGINSRMATFETTLPSKEEWFSNGVTGTFLAYAEKGEVFGFAKIIPISKRACYSGVGEVSIYLHPEASGKGIGTQLLQQLIKLSEEQGFWTLKASIFPENVASLRLHEKCGFRKLGYHEKIAQLDGIWRDTILLERRTQFI